MFKADSTPPRRITKEQEPQARYYTVGYAPNGMKGNPSPQLTLKGRWLEKIGFMTGQPVIITLEPGCMVIEAEFKF